MRTILFCRTSIIKKFFRIALILTSIAATILAPPAQAHTPSMGNSLFFFKSGSEPADQLTIQATMYVIENTSTLKVIVKDWESKGAVIIFRSKEGRIIHNSRFVNKQTYIGTFDVSQLPDGMYSMEVYDTSWIGYGKKVYKNTFEIKSQTRRSVSIKPTLDTNSNNVRPLEAHK